MVFLCSYLNKAVGGEEDHAEVVHNEDLLQLEGLSVGHQRGPHLHESGVSQTDDEAGPGGGHHEPALHPRVCGERERRNNHSLYIEKVDTLCQPALHPRVCGGEGKEKQSFTAHRKGRHLMSTSPFLISFEIPNNKC